MPGLWFEDESYEATRIIPKSVDGDSFANLAKRVLRLVGIDAPELQQHGLRDGKGLCNAGCWQTANLAQLVAAAPVSLCRSWALTSMGVPALQFVVATPIVIPYQEVSS